MRSPRRAGAARLEETGSERREVPEVALLVVFPTVRFFAALFFAGTARLLKLTAALRLLSGARANRRRTLGVGCV